MTILRISLPARRRGAHTLRAEVAQRHRAAHYRGLARVLDLISGRRDARRALAALREMDAAAEAPTARMERAP